jgi:hypothetical protein
MVGMAPQGFLPGSTSSGHFRHVGHPVRYLPTLLDPTHHRIHCQHNAIRQMKHCLSKDLSKRQDPGNRCGVSCACRSLMRGRVTGTTMATYFSKFWVNGQGYSQSSPPSLNNHNFRLGSFTNYNLLMAAAYDILGTEQGPI